MKATIQLGRLLGTLGPAIIMAGCASMPGFDHFKAHESASEPTPDPGQSVVYFYREKKFRYSGVSYYVYDDDKIIGGLKSGTYFFYVTSPGTRTFCAETEAKVCKTLRLEADKTYYVIGDVEMGMWVGRPDLTIASDLEGEATIPHLTYATLMSKEEIEAQEAEDDESF